MILYDNFNPKGTSLGSVKPHLKWHMLDLSRVEPEELKKRNDPKNIYGRPAKRGNERKSGK